ncbi:voltage-dependent T-type calcium channel subunit alpha-1G [Sardina pilchardus]|uniref:voltage-dependent T-type calcium channel subunit alpha-1G n=1 Tax=Sardina pilchardus TaxID=27697 RepID=UPI002E13191A
MVCNPWFERMSMLVILLNCVTLGMFHPCEDILCDSERCKILEDFDDFIFAFFAVEMVIKMVALGIFGKKCYLGDTWNRLDFFIILAGMLEYSLNLQNVSFSAVRTVRVLRPLRAINRVPSMRILVTLLLDTLPMLGNVLLLCFFVFFIFGIVGVQLWAGLLRNRCFVPENFSLPLGVDKFYRTENDDESPFICSQPKENGMLLCNVIPNLYKEELQCTLDMTAVNETDNTTCVNWNQYYTNCSAGKHNPFKDAINFDNIGYAWIAIFQVITLEGWVDIMYFVMDSHSFYNFIYFILLIIVGSFFMINLCLVVIATQFSETKQRESQLMKEQRVRFLSNASTLASFSEPGSCYDELLKYLVHVVRKTGRQLCHLVRVAARQAGLSVRASPVLEQTSQKRRRQKQQQQKRASIHHLMHHHHHHHYHLGNGSVLRGTDRDPETGAGSRRSRIGSLMLPDTSVSASIAAGGAPDLSLHCTPSTSMALQAYKRNSVPFAGPAHKNYPTLQSSFLLEQRRQRSFCENAAGEGGSCMDSIFTNLNIPPPPKSTSQGLVDTHIAPGDIILCISALLSRSSTISCSSTLDTTLAFDPKSCPYCMKANDSEGTEANETADSDSEGVYEFTQDAHYRDRRDPTKKNKMTLGARTAKVIRFWRLVCDTFRKIVDSKYFGRGIMIAILINTLSMGIEYHEQPEEFTNALEISNIVFTSLFALEMLLKVLVYGPFGYIKNPYNIFDGIIVVISVWEIVGQQGGGLSVLRTFRLMRVLKLVRFMPALQRQLVVLMKTMDNVATFCMLLMLFIFIFSILGMHLFGCKFSSERAGDTLPDRKNFDSLLWAIVTVFQILTQEDWNKVLYNGMASTTSWAALYFIALMTFGNYVLFNLLVAILVEGFQTEGDESQSNSEMDLYSQSMEDLSNGKGDVVASTVVPINGHVDLKTSLTPPLITHTAATPMPIPKIAGAGDPALTFESRRSSNIPIDPSFYNKSPSSVRSSPPHVPWSSASSWNSRRSSWNSLGRAPSLKRQKRQSGERRSLLSADGQSSSEEEEVSGADAGGGGDRLSECDNASLGRTDSFGQRPQHRRMESVETRSSLDLPPDTLQVPYLYRSASIHSARPPHPQLTAAQDCNGKSSPSAATNQLSLDEHHSEDENVEEEGNMSRWLRLLRWLSQKEPEWCRQRSSWSLYLFPPECRGRIICKKIISHKMFDHVVLLIIFINCITIAMERPRIDPSSAERIFLKMSNYIFTGIFVAEMALKVVALGWCFGEKTYLKSTWNILDGLLVMISVIDILVTLISNSGTKILGMLRVLRLLRTLRPLRVISRAPGLKLVVETLMSSLKPIGNIVVICCAFFIIFGILGVQLFKGKFFVCHGEDTRNITNKSDCLNADYKWLRHKYNFDNLGQALMSLFVLASKDGWVDIMYDGLDAVGVDQQPVMNYNPWMLLYFISFLLIVSFFVLNMFVGVVVENFHKCRRHQEAEEAKIREEKRLKRMEKKRRSKEKELAEAQSKPYYSDYSPTRLLIHKMCTSHYLDLFITIVIGLNVITMSMEHYQQPKVLDEALKICNYIFTVIFVLESVFKLVAFGFRRFFKDRWNQLDLAIVLLSIMGITLEEIEVNASLPINPTIIRIMRVLRIARVLKLLKMAVGMRALLDTVMQALPQVGNLGLLFMLLFFIYAALGVELFGDQICDATHPCEGLGRYATFKNFGMAFLLLFRVSTGDNWNGIMKDTLRDCAGDNVTCYNAVVSPIYFVSFVLTAQFVLVNVVIAVLMKHLEESNKEAKDEAEMEAELELEAMGAHLGGGPGGGAGLIGGHLSPFVQGDNSGAASPLTPPPWMFKRDPQENSSLANDSPPPTMVDIRRDSTAHSRVDSPQCLEPPMEQTETLEATEAENQQEEHLLTVRKTCVGRTHSLPNDSYMFLPLLPAASATSSGPLPHTTSLHPHSGSSGSIPIQQSETGQLLAVPSQLFRPISPSSLSELEGIPRIPPPQRTHNLTRPLRRQVAVRTDSQETVHSEQDEVVEGAVVGLSELTGPPLSSSPQLPPQHQPSLCLVPAAPGASPKAAHSSVRTQHNPRDQYNVFSPRSSLAHSPSPPPLPPPRPQPPSPQQEDTDFVDQEVSCIIQEGLAASSSSSSSAEGQEEPSGIGQIKLSEGRSPYLRQLKKYHSADTQGCQGLLLLRPSSWLDEQRRHSTEACSSGESSPQLSSVSSGFVSRADSLQQQMHTTTTPTSPHSRKKKMSPPCISVDPPEGRQEPPGVGFHPAMGLGTVPSPLTSRDTSCLRRRAPSSDSKDSFDLGGGGEPLPQEGAHTSNLLTLPSFSFDKSSSEH